MSDQAEEGAVPVGAEGQRLAAEWARLRSERRKFALESYLRRKEPGKDTTRPWKDIFASPVTLAIVGGFITLMTNIISNSFSASENARVEATKTKLSAQAAKETLQAELIKKIR